MWLPGDRIDIGDVGVLEGGRFRRATNLTDLNVDFQLDVPGVPQPLRYSSTKQTTIWLGGGASIQDPSASVASVEARVDMEFGDEGAFVFHADGIQQLRMRDRGSVDEQIVELAQARRWKSRWYLVDEVYRAECATIIVSQGASASLSLLVKGAIDVGSVALSDPSLNLSVVSSSGQLVQVLGVQDVNPLYTCSKIAGGWFRSRYLRPVREKSTGPTDVGDEVRLVKASIGDLLRS